jgi:hypothetical protein
VEDLEREEGVAKRAREWEREPLVPYGPGGSRVVRSGCEAVARIEVDGGVGLEVAVAPVHVLQVLGGDYCDFEVERGRVRRRHWWW